MCIIFSNHFLITFSFLSGRVYLKGKKTAGLQDIWALKYGLNNDGFTFNTQDDALSKRVRFVCSCVASNQIK